MTKASEALRNAAKALEQARAIKAQEEENTVNDNYTTSNPNNKMPVIFADDHDVYEPYDDGDYTLLVEVASWLLRTYDDARQDWQTGYQGLTEDGLLLSLGRMHLTDVQLAHFHRMLLLADSIVEHEEEDRAKMRALAEKVAKKEARS